ncbi:hypothetical protein Q3G72_006304 [Acer saccharum]|nr:hypothetical protein Q3G72_006304 [Acer saccharum]
MGPERRVQEEGERTFIKGLKSLESPALLVANWNDSESISLCSQSLKSHRLYSLAAVETSLLSLPGLKLVVLITILQAMDKSSALDYKNQMFPTEASLSAAVRQQSEELAGSVSKLIDPQLADAMDMSDVQDEFSAVITKASVTLVLGLETKVASKMYVNGINMILTSSIPVLGSLLSPVLLPVLLG